MLRTFGYNQRSSHVIAAKPELITFANLLSLYLQHTTRLTSTSLLLTYPYYYLHTHIITIIIHNQSSSNLME